MGTYMLGRLEGLERSPHVGHVHGLGLLLGIDMVQDKKTKEPFPAEQMKRLVRMVRERGVVLRDCETILAIAPPLIIRERDADRICDAIEGSLADL
jgi:adenosylmethionine-8-amino-7-oxononanoate aminotransferase